LKRLLAAATLIGMVGGLGAVAAFGRTSVDLGPLGVSLAWELSPQGRTVLAFPPLGTVSAVTHAGPGSLLVTLERVDVDALRAFINASDEARLATVGALKRRAAQALEIFAVRQLVAGALGGAFLWGAASAAFARRPGRPAVVAAAAGFAAVLAMAAAARFTYDVQGFQSPVYAGALRAVPWLVRTVDEALVKVEELDQRLRALSTNLYRMYEQLESFPPAGALAGADVTVLHVSDFHNHPSAARITAEIARSFGVDFVVNTGDLTDFGTLLEAELIGGLDRIEAPHFFVSGNHETPAILEKIASLGAVTLIDGELVERSGLVIAGVPDPRSLSESAESITQLEAADHAARINERLAAMEERPDILAVHNFRIAQAIEPGAVPAVLFGHSHAAGVQFRSGTAYVNAGTTGGAGLRGLEAERDVPITLAVIYFQRLAGERGTEAEHAAPAEPQTSEPRARLRSRVLAVDIVRLSPYGGGVTLERRLAPQ